VDLAGGSQTSGAIHELKSLDELSNEKRKSKPEGKAVLKSRPKKAQGKVKTNYWGTGHGRSRGRGRGRGHKRPSGPDLPRTSVLDEPIAGTVLEWKGNYGWIKPFEPVDHPLAGKHRGRIYIHEQDLDVEGGLTPGSICEFLVFSDASGLGAEECVVKKAAPPEE